MPCRQWDVREQGAWLAGGSTVCRAEFGAIAISSAQRFLHIQVQSEVSSEELSRFVGFQPSPY